MIFAGGWEEGSTMAAMQSDSSTIVPLPSTSISDGGGKKGGEKKRKGRDRCRGPPDFHPFLLHHARKRGKRRGGREKSSARDRSDLPFDSSHLPILRIREGDRGGKKGEERKSGRENSFSPTSLSFFSFVSRDVRGRGKRGKKRKEEA